IGARQRWTILSSASIFPTRSRRPVPVGAFESRRPQANKNKSISGPPVAVPTFELAFQPM
ncbi:MAG: hypothetical protein KIT73_11295, partial [Burkholderiales bacterium]|nr:hypothetical protein [Burkholderiales bacterium]